ncbi:hypothetical protein AB0P15_36645 [Streptomyces sp. NPDC087917]|uniref:hypothetical protein n=1 Tax=Streptomyces sp. NPDC087917 TaxID=3155060 RepID=UPI00341BD69F
MNEHVERYNLSLRFSPSGMAAPEGLNLSVGTTRVGDTSVSELTLYAEDWVM